MFFHERLEEKSPGRVPVHFPSRWGNFMPAVIPGRPQLVADPNTSTARTWTVLEWETTRGPRGENWKNQQSTPEGSGGKPLKRAWRPPSSVSSTETALPSALGEPGGGAGGEGFASCKVDSKPGVQALRPQPGSGLAGLCGGVSKLQMWVSPGRDRGTKHSGYLHFRTRLTCLLPPNIPQSHKSEAGPEEGPTED